VETAAYYITLVAVVAAPAAFSAWFVIHPFAAFWRRVGPLPTYTAVCVVAAGIGATLFAVRGTLLSIHFGVRLPLVAVAALLFVVSMYFGAKRKKDLRHSTMLGLPEVSRGNQTAGLVTGGIYARIRHPRYLEAGFGLAAVAFFTNYLAAYVLAAVYVPMVYAIVVLEERELSDRFGRDYAEYCRRVPRFIPRRAKHETLPPAGGE
jgi:protein-S-isoprenylcysteine O-methyltransferase Ste14